MADNENNQHGSFNYEPTIGEVKSLKPFIFWTQTTLPTVFDDSLSYYEAMSKIAKMLNTLLENENTNAENIIELKKAYDKTKEYVNDYFANLDLTSEVNTKIEEMYADGRLTDIVVTKATQLVTNYLYGEDGEGGKNAEIEELISQANADITKALTTFGTNSAQALRDFDADATEALRDFNDDADASLGAIPDTVETWLEQNFTNPQSTPLDATLSIESAAAQAKATGEAIESAIAVAMGNSHWNYRITDVDYTNSVLANHDGSNAQVTSAAVGYDHSLHIASVAPGEAYTISCVGRITGPNKFAPAYAFASLTYDLQDNPVYVIRDIYPRSWDDQTVQYEIVRNKQVIIPNYQTGEPVNTLLLMGFAEIAVTPSCAQLVNDMDTTLTSTSLPAQGKATGDAVDTKIPWPVTEGSKDVGTAGKRLASNGDGSTSWVDGGGDYDEEIENLQNDVLDLKSAVSENVESATVTSTINTTAIGLTVKAVNNTLVIYGTASATRRYCFLNGQNEFHTTGDVLDKTLDGGVYNITITETGYETNVPFVATYSTFGNSFTLTAGVNNFTGPVMIGIFLGSETDYGTSENPTVISFSAEKIIAKDPVARDDIAEVLSEIINLSEEVSVVPNSTDYNTLTTAGTYRVTNLSNANTMSNIPAGIGAHKLIVFKISDGQKIYQILLRSGSVKIYIRNKDGSSAWTDWVQTTFSTDLVSLISTKYNYTSTALANGTDYDSVGTGSYYCSSMSSAQSMSNCPVSVGHRLFVFESYNASDFVQIVMANREFYFRYRGEQWKSYALYKPDVPTYYASHIANREEKANTIIADVGIYGDSFAAIADTHWGRNAQNSPDLIKHIALNTPINRLMMLGDYYITQSTEAGAYKALNTCLGAFKNKGMRLHIIPGNHDYNKGTVPGYPVLTESQVYGQIMTGQYDVTCDDDTCSFWFDNTQKKIRYYFTTCMYDSSYNKASYKWIFGEMANMPSGYKFIIFTHTGLSGSLSTSHEYSEYLTGAMAAVRDKTTYTFDGSTFDYSSVNATPMFVYAGHNHFDSVFTYNGIACIQETTDAYYYEEGGLTRTQGTVTEQAFDIVTSDLQNSVVYLTRVGAGHDRIVHYGMETVTTTKSLTATLTGTLTWTTSNNSVATVSNGTVTKAGSGYCTITATDTNGLTEDWVIKC